MTERSHLNNDVLFIPQRLPTQLEKEMYLRNTIIPAMDKRRGRTIPMTSSEIERKLYNPPSSNKQGEFHELTFELRQSGDELLTPDMALEIADLIYYSYQPNAADIVNHKSLEAFIFIILGEMPHALNFAIVKYETRLRYGNRNNYKEIESEVMEQYFKRHNLPESLIINE